MTSIYVNNSTLCDEMLSLLGTESSLPDKLPLDELVFHLNSPSNIAVARIRALGIHPPATDGFSEEQTCQCTITPMEGGLASGLVRVLFAAIQNWKNALPVDDHNMLDSSFDLDGLYSSLKVLHRVLGMLLEICKCDLTLAEEMARGCGMHAHLSSILCLDVYSILDCFQKDASHPSSTTTKMMTIEEYQRLEDALIEMQDLAAELAHVDATMGYPVKVSPYSMEELHSRLPLVFSIVSPVGRYRECFMVHQVTDRQSAQDDVGFVMWPSAVVLASWLLDHEEVVIGKRVLEIGAGCGLTGLVAARIKHKKENVPCYNSQQSTEVILSDFNRKVLMNIGRNISLNGLDDVAKVMHLDFYSHRGSNHAAGGWQGIELSQYWNEHPDRLLDLSPQPQSHLQPPVDIILAADTICKASDSVAVSNTIYDALAPGGEAIVVSADAQHRFGIDIFEKECHRNGLQVTIYNVADLCQGNLLLPRKNDPDPCGIRQTSGYVDDMTLTMFRVRKPQTFAARIDHGYGHE